MLCFHIGKQVSVQGSLIWQVWGDVEQVGPLTPLILRNRRGRLFLDNPDIFPPKMVVEIGVEKFIQCFGVWE